MIILGAHGLIGSHVCAALPTAVKAPRSDQCDLRDASEARYAISGHDVVINCAGTTAGSGGAGEGGRNLVADNVHINMSVFDACAQAGVKKLICLSSTTGYPQRSLLSEDQYFEGDVHPAYSAVGESKRFIERLAAMYPEVETVFLRCSGTYGPGADFNAQTSHVIEATVAKVARGDNPLTIWGDGEDERDAVHIDDLVRAIVLAIDAPAGAYNIASGESMSINEIVAHLCKGAGYRPRIEHDLSKPAMIRTRNLDISKARNVLRWSPAITMRDGLAATYRWYVREALKCA